MKSTSMIIRKCLLGILYLLVPTILVAQKDWRNIDHGDIIPDEAYSDQPYVVQTDDGAWLCIMTTGAGARRRKWSAYYHLAKSRSGKNMD